MTRKLWLLGHHAPFSVSPRFFGYQQTKDVPLYASQSVVFRQRISSTSMLLTETLMPYNMWSTAILVLISITNSLFLSLTIWAALQLKHTDWWVVFLIIFIMGSAYEIAYCKSISLNMYRESLTVSKSAATSPPSCHPTKAVSRLRSS
jgi:hypothetical protein